MPIIEVYSQRLNLTIGPSHKLHQTFSSWSSSVEEGMTQPLCFYHSTKARSFYLVRTTTRVA